MNNVGLPINEILYKSVVERKGHTHVGINGERGRADIVDLALSVAVRFLGKSENAHVVALFLQFIPKVFHRGNDSVGCRGKEIGCN